MPRVHDDHGPLKAARFDNRNEWHRTEAIFGQNDYIDILGDGTIHPSRLLTNVPHWLRGFRGNELQRINRKRIAIANMQKTKPRRWADMHRRADYLYKYLNTHHRPPGYEPY